MSLVTKWRELALRSSRASVDIVGEAFGVMGELRGGRYLVCRYRCGCVEGPPRDWSCTSSFRGLSGLNQTVFLILRERKVESGKRKGERAPQRGGSIVKSVVGA
jgi:hypothetical protein